MAYNRWLEHHQVKGAHWGVHNGPPYPLDRSISDGKKLIKSDGSPQSKNKLKKQKTVFVSGSSKTQDPKSEYYRGELPKDIRLALREHIRNGDKIIVGDAPGIDRQVQDYLKKQKYDNVEIYGPGKEVRYTANPKWKTNPIDDLDHDPGSKEWLAKKDIAMTEAADEGLAIILDDGAKATRNNVRRLLESQKVAKVYSLNKDGTNMWADENELMNDKVVPKTTTVSRSMAKANKIYDTLSDQEKYFLTAEENTPRYINPGEYNKKHSSNVYSRIEQYKDTPVSVIDIWQNEDKIGEVSIAVRNGTEYRHKGYASRALENGLKYFYNNPEIEYLVWGVNAKNRPSIELAKKYGFTFFEDVDGEWHTYVKGKEVKHTMSYNRWLIPDELEHHQRKGAHWGVYNGPPYPLERQKRFSPDGGKVSQKKYLQVTGSGGTTAKRKRHTTSEKTEYQRKQSAERQERKANPEGTAWEQMERDNPINKLKGAYRRFKKNQERIAEEERAEKANFNSAMDRLNKLDIPDDIKRKMRNEALGYDPDDKLRGQHWGTRNGPPYSPRDAMRIDFDGDKFTPKQKEKDPLWDESTFSENDTDSERLNKIIDSYLDKQKERKEAAKQHGTAEEVMKYRDTFTKEEWKEIADRLEAEARVKKLLDKPVTTQNNQGEQQNQQNQNSKPTEEKLHFADRKAKEIYEKGTARDIYDNRDKFTPEQLEKVTKRLEAEEKIGKYADVQVKIKSTKQLNLEKARDYLKIAGDSADAISKILKLLDSGDKKDGGGGGAKVGEVAKIISGVANAGDSGGKKKGKREKG